MLVFFRQLNNVEVFNFDNILYMSTLKVNDSWRFCIYTDGSNKDKYTYYNIKSKSVGNQMIQQILDAVKRKKRFIEIEF